MRHIYKNYVNGAGTLMHANACLSVRMLAVSGLLLFALDHSLAAETQQRIDVAIVATRVEQPTLDTPGTTVSLDETRISRSGTESLQETLRYEPGVSVPFDFASGQGLIPYLSGGSQSINIRGIEGNRVALQLDGIRQPEDFVSQSFLGAGGPGRIYFDPAVLGRLEIFKSASSSLYGSDALGGTVSALTVSPTTLLGSDLTGKALENSLTYSTLNDSIHNRFAAAVGDGRFAASVVYSYRDGNERRNNGSDRPNPADFTSHALVATGVMRSGDWDWSLTYDRFDFSQFTRGKAAEGIFFDGLLVNEFVSLDEDRDRERISFGVTNHQPLAGFFENAAAMFYYQDSVAESKGVQRGLSPRFFPPPPGTQPRDRLNELRFKTQIYGANASAENLFLHEKWSHSLRYGVEFSRSDVSSDFIRTDFLPVVARENRIGMAPSKVDRASLFVFNEIAFGQREQWSLFPGIRLDHYKVSPDNNAAFLNRTIISGTGESVPAVDYDNTALAPSIALLYRFNEAFNTFVSYGRGIRNPSAEELNGVFTHGTDFIVVPNPGLREERADSFEFGFQYSNNRLNGRTSVFYDRFSNFLQANTLLEERVGEPDILTTTNLERVDIYGFELALDYRFVNAFIGLNGWESGVSFAYARGRDKSAGEPLNTIDPAKVVAYIGLDPEDMPWDIRLIGTFIDRKSTNRINQNTDAGAFDPVPSVFLLDLQAGYQLATNWALRGSVNNLTDRSYYLWSTSRRGGGHGGGGADRNTQPGINASISLNARF